MPTRLGRDKQGCFARWGVTGKKYYYRCGSERAQKAAKKQAEQQGAAAKAAGDKDE